MGNAEKAVALSLLVHAFLAAGVVALVELPSPECEDAALDVTSVELSLADDDSVPVAGSSAASSARDAANAIMPPATEPPPTSDASKIPESSPAPGTVEIPLAREPVVEMCLEKTVSEAAMPVSGVEQAHVEAPASPRRNITPKYPRASRLRGEEGLVRLELAIDAFGAVAGVSVVVSSGFKELDKAAVKAVEAAKFNPASRNGKKVESSVSLTFVFKLK
jgi:TonB family protein